MKLVKRSGANGAGNPTQDSWLEPSNSATESQLPNNHQAPSTPLLLHRRYWMLQLYHLAAILMCHHRSFWGPSETSLLSRRSHEEWILNYYALASASFNQPHIQFAGYEAGNFVEGSVERDWRLSVSCTCSSVAKLWQLFCVKFPVPLAFLSTLPFTTSLICCKIHVSLVIPSWGKNII